MTQAAEALAKELGANCARFFRVDNDYVLEFCPSWADGALNVPVGRWPAQNIGAHYLDEIRAGCAFGIVDVAHDPLVAGSRFAEIGAGAIIMAPIIRNGDWCAGLYVNHLTRREWTENEIAFVRDIADITWDSAERSKVMLATQESLRLFREIADVAPVLIWMSDTTKACTWFNKPWLDFTGRTMEQELGDGWSDGVHPDYLDRCLATYTGAFDRREPFQMDYRLRRHDGVYRIVNDIGVPRFSSDGRFLGYIGSCLDVTGERTAEAALRASEERERQRRRELETMLSAIPVAVFIAEDKACTRISANPAGLELLRLPEGANTSKSAPEAEMPKHFEVCSGRGDVLSPDQLPIQWAAATGRRIEGGECEVRFNDGECRNLLGNALPLFDAAGEVTGAVGAFLDITERKRQENQIRLLMREVNHRSKNMLAVVQAVARQTLAANPQDFLNRFGKRIEALAASQDLLVKNDWKGVDLDELVRSQLGPFEELIGTRIRLQGRHFFLSASAAQVLGMSLHELATNAGKYGALSRDEGRVEIAWFVERGGKGEEAFVMAWREQCAHPITAPAKQGFGSSVIGSMAEMSLGAKVELDYPASGMTWQLRCPAGEVLDSDTRPLPRVEGQPGRAASAKARILVVEDEALVAVEIAHVLTGAGFHILGPVRSVSAALELLKRTSCDAAVLDINLGRETSEAIAAELTASETPFVTLSGYSQDDVQHPAFVGAPTLAKPIRPELLIAELERCLQRAV